MRDAVGIRNRKRFAALVDDRKEAVRQNLAVPEFVREALPVEARDVDPEKRPRDRREAGRNSHAFFHGQAVGKTLKPVGRMMLAPMRPASRLPSRRGAPKSGRRSVIRSYIWI